MIDSMTGFGRGEAQVDGYTATVELRSVNSRFCEVTIRLPRSISDRESDVQRMVKENFSRGRINVQIQVEAPAEVSSSQVVDHEAAASYRALLEDLRDAAGIDEPVRLEHILRFSDVFRPAEDSEMAAEVIWKAVSAALEASSLQMLSMRRREGIALEKELLERISEIEENLKIVEQEAPSRLPTAHERILSRLSEILDDERIDRDRIEFEMAVLADKLDLREECVRLQSHIDVFREAIASSEPVGRKLNFLSQEMNREINTIGSKANDANLSHVVVGMKEQLEKIREQIENVE
jgi:uncharacterized protein (TIGR00255 family)